MVTAAPVSPAAGLHPPPPLPPLPPPEPACGLPAAAGRPGPARFLSAWFVLAHRHNDLHSAAAGCGGCGYSPPNLTQHRQLWDQSAISIDQAGFSYLLVKSAAFYCPDFLSWVLLLFSVSPSPLQLFLSPSSSSSSFSSQSDLSTDVKSVSHWKAIKISVCYPFAFINSRNTERRRWTSLLCAASVKPNDRAQLPVKRHSK